MNNKKRPTSANNYQSKFQIYLNNELNKRIAKNPKYSLRSFAKFLEIAPAYLSRVINGNLTLSDKMIKKLCVKLKITDDDCKKYILENKSQRKIQKAYNIKGLIEIPDSIKDVHSNRYAKIISEILEINKYKKLPVNEISKILDITPSEIRALIKRLIEINVIELQKNGDYKKTHKFNISTINHLTPELKQKLRKNLKETILKSTDYIERDDVKKIFSATTFSIPSSLFDEFKADIILAERSIINKYDSSDKEKDMLLECAICIFPWTN